MRTSFIFLFALFLVGTIQAQRTRNVAWYTPSTCSTSKINGLAIGLLTGCFQDNSTKKQTINGVDIEVFGTGFLLPLAGGYDGDGNSFFYKGWEQVEVDIIPIYITTVNGIVLSGGGIAGDDVKVNGINIAGIEIMTGIVNGITIGGLFANLNRFVNGISIGGVFRNESIQTNGIQIGGFFNASKRMRGLQIGLFNHTKNLKGVQIGLWNKSDKRALPLLNFQF